jgi:hypothetical protein
MAYLQRLNTAYLKEFDLDKLLYQVSAIGIS